MSLKKISNSFIDFIFNIVIEMTSEVPELDLQHVRQRELLLPVACR